VWLGHILAAGLQPDQVSYNTLMKAEIACGRLAGLQEHLSAMQLQGLKPTVLTYGTVVSAYADAGDVDAAQSWYDKALKEKKVNVNLLSSMMKAYVKVGNLKAAERCMQEAQEEGIEPNHVVYTSMINAYAQRGDVESAGAWFRLAKQQRQVRLNLWSYNAMIKACAKAGDSQRAQAWFDMALSDGQRPDVVTYTLMISAYAKVGRVGEARRWLERLENSGVQPNVVSYTEAIKAGAQSMTSKAPGLREYQLFSRMLEQGIWPTVARSREN
ncbi:unnamed protein product, partial [Effrenium voratum]